jgi:uncharacterized coiled-coil protein SlyX
MSKQSGALVLRIPRDIQATLSDVVQRLDRLEARVAHLEKQFDDVSKIVRYSLGQSSETQFRQSEQQSRIDELFKRLETLLSSKEPQ